MTPTPRTDAAQHEGLIRGCATPTKVVRADFARTLERDITELNERLIDRQQTLMLQAVKLQEALEAADECLALIEDVGHGTMSDNVTIARGIVLAALSQNARITDAAQPAASNNTTDATGRRSRASDC